MTFDFSKAKVAKPQEAIAVSDSAETQAQVAQVAEVAEVAQSVVKPLAVTPVKLAVKPLPQAVAKPVGTAPKPIAIEGLELLDQVPQPTLSYKEQLAEMPNLDDLANEFNNSEQPDQFDDAATSAVHKACLAIESAIDNAEEVRTQLTFIMTELRKYPETAAKIYDSDIATMVKALRHNYNVVAFAKAANKKAKAEKASKVNDLLAEADASGLFDGLDL